MPSSTVGNRSPSRRRPAWVDWPDGRLLDLRLCDLGISLRGSWIEEAIDTLHAELAARRLLVRVHFWLGEEWFCPDGVPGVAVPFFLAHPRLMRLERRQMLEVEGGTRAALLRLLRHEVGHAVDHAFRLNRRRRWQEVFGHSSEPYPDYYRPNPASRRFVLHLDHWYAQSHPDEDFAETFAVWLAPRSQWRRRYEGWPALRKLEYMDALMAELADRKPLVRSREQVDPLRTLKKTLRQHYAEKRERYAPSTTTLYDRDLLRVFADGRTTPRGESAAGFIRRHRAEIRRLVAEGTGEYEFTLEMVLRDMIKRSRELKLRAVGPQREMRLQFAILLTAKTMEYLYRGREWHAL